MNSLLDVETDLARPLARLGSRVRFAEAMAQQTGGEELRFNLRSETVQARPRLAGAVFRAWVGGRWVEAASSGLDRLAFESTSEEVASQASKGSGGRDPPGDSPRGSAERVTESKKPIADLSTEERVALASEYRAWALSVPGIVDANVVLSVARDERLYLSTAGARRYQCIDRVSVSVTPIAIENGRIEYDFAFNGGTGGQEILTPLTEERIVTAAREAKALLSAEAPPSGRMAVLLDPQTAGAVAHESFGHGTEADQFVRDRSYLRLLLGQTLGPPGLTIVDDGSYPGGWGSIYFDDEGHPGQRTVLVEDGRFVRALHDRTTAATFQTQATGNTRRANFLSRPFVRMTNTFFEPGDWSLEELLEEMKEGIVLEHATSGIEDPLGGNMQCRLKKGHRVQAGRVGPLVSSMALSGRVLEFLSGIRGVGKREYFEMRPGSCGKGFTDVLPAATGGTYVLSELVVGRA
ncbi:MAG: TldD/PmbA family protein [Thermoplasmata archaeon]